MGKEAVTKHGRDGEPVAGRLRAVEHEIGEMKVEGPLIIYGEDGRYTKEMYTVYGY